MNDGAALRQMLTRALKSQDWGDMAFALCAAHRLLSQGPGAMDTLSQVVRETYEEEVYNCPNCPACGRYEFEPRPDCPECNDAGWVPFIDPIEGNGMKKCPSCGLDTDAIPHCPACGGSGRGEDPAHLCGACNGSGLL